MSSLNKKSSCWTYLKTSLASLSDSKMSLPRILVTPLSYFSRPVINFMIVLLPLPLLPRIPTI